MVHGSRATTIGIAKYQYVKKKNRYEVPTQVIHSMERQIFKDYISKYITFKTHRMPLFCVASFNAINTSSCSISFQFSHIVPLNGWQNDTRNCLRKS